jgi:hypothetical protein
MREGFNNEKYSNHLFEIKVISDLMFQAQANSKQEEGISTKLHVNTLLLASQSSYFKALFTNGMRESHDNKTTFFVSDEEEKEAFIDVIRYLYDGEFKSHSPVHLLKVLILADEYSVLSVVEASVAKILEDTYSIETYCMFLEIPESLRHSESFAPLLKTASHELVKKFLQFDHLWQSDEFLQLTSKGLATILQSDELNVATENTIYQAVLKWINRPPHVQNRRVYLRELMPLVRFPMMSAHFLHDVVSRFVTKEPYFLPMYIEALKYHAIGSERVDIERSLGTINCSPQFRSRRHYKDFATTSFVWEISNIARLMEEKEFESHRFFVGGYCMYLQLECVPSKSNSRELMLGLYLMIDEVTTDINESYFCPIEYTFRCKNYQTGN